MAVEGCGARKHSNTHGVRCIGIGSDAQGPASTHLEALNEVVSAVDGDAGEVDGCGGCRKARGASGR